MLKSNNMYCFLLWLLMLIYSCSATSFTVDSCVKMMSDLKETNINPVVFEPYASFRREKFHDAGSFGSFNFIIVGGGTTGAVIANRLSEEKDWNILVLEAGVEQPDITLIPESGTYIELTNYTYFFKSTPQKHICRDTKNNFRCICAKGKMLGGSSSIMSLGYARGNEKQFNNIARLVEDEEWSYENVLPYYLKSENSSIKFTIDPEYHCNKGPLRVEQVQEFDSLGKQFLLANQELGSKICDYNGRSQMCFSRMQSTSSGGERYSTNSAYLKPIRDRTNLKIQTNAFVTKILIGDKNKTAYGVEFVLNDNKYQAFATQEVILSAGVFGTPQLLMLSGVGPKEHLNSKNITVIKNLPVGQSLREHTMTYVIANSNYTQVDERLQEMCESFTKGSGPLTTESGIQAMGFFNSKNPKSEDPDLLLIISYFRKVVTLLLMNIDTKSIGTFSLNTSNPFDTPLIDYNFLDVPEDSETILGGIRYIERLLKTKSMKKMRFSKITNNNISECKQYPFESDEYYKCVIPYISMASFHAVGTAKMGPNNCKDCVLTSKLKVKGIENLRVADASVFPDVIHANTAAPCVMVGEKVSDFIKKEFHILTDKLYLLV